MAITYQERAELAKDAAFRGRVQIASLTFADYISNEDELSPRHDTRMVWATKAITLPEAMAVQVSQLVVNDAKVIEFGAEISDPDLQSATETTINKWLVPFAAGPRY